MFIKIERENHSTIYQCKIVDFFHLKPDDKDGKTPDERDPGSVIISMDSSNVDVEVNKEGVSIYLMNDEGKTIDSFNW